jgi:hypothetical protein
MKISHGMQLLNVLMNIIVDWFILYVDYSIQLYLKAQRWELVIAALYMRILITAD